MFLRLDERIFRHGLKAAIAAVALFSLVTATTFAEEPQTVAATFGKLSDLVAVPPASRLTISPTQARANVPVVNFFRLMDATGDQVGQSPRLVEKPAAPPIAPDTLADSQVYRVPLAKPGYSYQWTSDGVWRDTPEPGTNYPQGTVDWLTPRPDSVSKSPSGCRLTPNGWKCN